MNKTALLICICCGILASQTASAQWAQCNGPDGGQVSAISVNTSNGYLYAIANGGGFRSTNAGVSWTPLVGSLPGDLTVYCMGSFGSNTYCLGYLATSITPDVYHSTDFGDTWTKKTGSGFAIIAVPRTLAMAGTNLLAGGTTGGGVYKSTDNGNTWATSSTGMPSSFDVGYFANSGADIYAGSSVVTSVDSIYRSTDNGTTWTATATTFFGASGLTGLGANASGLFASTNIAGVHRSTNNGANWTKINPAGIPASNFSASLLVTSTNVFTGLGDFVFRADQNGNNWDSAYTGMLHPGAASQAIRALAQSGSTIVAATNGLGPGSGIHRSTDNGDTWVKANSGLRALKINGMLGSGSIVYAAGDAQGFFRSTDFGATWAEINNGITWNTGTYCIAQVGSDLLAGCSISEIYRSSNNGDSWTLINSGFTGLNVFDFFATGSDVYTAGASGAAKSTDAGAN